MSAVEELPPDSAERVEWKDQVWPHRWQARFLDALSKRPVVTRAVKEAGVNRAWAYAVAKADPVFAAAWQEAWNEGIEFLEEHAVVWGTIGLEQEIVTETTTTTTDAEGRVTSTTTVTKRVDPGRDVNPALLQFVLRRHRPEYGETWRVQHGGHDGGPLVIEHQVYRTPTDERVRELLEIARQSEGEHPDVEGSGRHVQPPG